MTGFLRPATASQNSININNNNNNNRLQTGQSGRLMTSYNRLIRLNTASLSCNNNNNNNNNNIFIDPSKINV